MWGKSFVKNGEIKLWCLEKSWHCNILNDYVMLFYTEVFNPEVVPKMAFSIENDSGSTKFYVFTIVDYKLFQINEF